MHVACMIANELAQDLRTKILEEDDERNAAQSSLSIKQCVAAIRRQIHLIVPASRCWIMALSAGMSEQLEQKQQASGLWSGSREDSGEAIQTERLPLFIATFAAAPIGGVIAKEFLSRAI